MPRRCQSITGAECFSPEGSILWSGGGTRLSLPKRTPPGVDWRPDCRRFHIAYPPGAPARGKAISQVVDELVRQNK